MALSVYSVQGGVGVATHSRDGMYWATSHRHGCWQRDKDVRIYRNPASGDYRCIARLRGHKGPVWQIEFSNDSSRIVTASDDGTMRIWDVRTGECIKELILESNTEKIIKKLGGIFYAERELNSKNSIISINFNGNCSQIVTASRDRTVRIWDTKTGECIKELKDHGIRSEEFGESVYFSEDDSCVIVRSRADGTMVIWSSGKILHRIIALATALHPRCGQHSLLNQLPPYVIQQIAQIVKETQQFEMVNSDEQQKQSCNTSTNNGGWCTIS